jgi:hypothetical protein
MLVRPKFIPDAICFSVEFTSEGHVQKKNRPAAKIHLHLVLSEKTMRRINYLKDLIEAESYSEVVREAVRLYHELVEGADNRAPSSCGGTTKRYRCAASWSPTRRAGNRRTAGVLETLP